MKKGQLELLLGGTLITSAGFALLLVAIGIALSSFILHLVLLSVLQLSLIVIGLYIAFSFVRAGKLSADSIDYGDASLVLGIAFLFILSGLVTPLIASTLNIPFQIIG